MAAPEAKNVIERLEEQLRVEQKVRGFKKAIYKRDRSGQRELSHYAVQMLRAQAADIIELCELCLGNGHLNDEIVMAQMKGAQFAMDCFDKQNQHTCTMMADHVFYMLDLAKPKKVIVATAAQMPKAKHG